MDVSNFIKSNRLDVNITKYVEDCEKFVLEMKLGLKEADLGLPMIHTFISDEGEIPINEEIVVVDAGGTNLRVATVSFNKDKQPKISNFTRYDMPGVFEEVTADELFKTIASYIEPYLISCDRVGICFSYMSESTKDKDAIALELSKEVKVRGIKGKMICAEIKKVLAERGITGKTFTLVNDSVATLLAGKINAASDKHIGYILGTGQNICYSEKIENISRLVRTDTDSSTMIINVESAYYSGYEYGRIDDVFDSKSENPGAHRFEKMVSGAYLGGITLAVLQTAAEEGLFSKSAAEKILKLDRLSLVTVGEYYTDNLGDNILAECFGASENDTETAVKLIDTVMKRAAYLNALVIGAGLLKSEAGTNKEKPAVICIDGTTYYKMEWLRKYIKEFYETLIIGKLKRHFVEIKVEEAPIIGTAVAALT